MCSHESVCVCLWEFVDMDLVCTSVCIYTPVWYVHMSRCVKDRSSSSFRKESRSSRSKEGIVRSCDILWQ